jgi:hypothetical protein
VEQHTADLVREQALVQRTSAQGIGIAHGDKPRLVGINGHQAQIDERFEKGRAPPHIAIAPPAHAPRQAPVHRQRRARLGVTPIAENPAAQRDNVRIILDQAPADRIAADIQAESAHDCPL